MKELNSLEGKARDENLLVIAEKAKGTENFFSSSLYHLPQGKRIIVFAPERAESREGKIII